jgi:hypothetical protein
MVRGTRTVCFRISSLVFAAVLGCGSRQPVAEVEGIVKFGDKPLPHVRIQFMPDPEKGTTGPISTGTTDEQGHFKLVCADQRSGAVVGWHRVVITDMGVALPRKAREGRRDDEEKPVAPKQKPSLVSRVPDKYTTSGRTPLSAEVKPENPEIVFTLTR